MKRYAFKIAGCYDTETTTLDDGPDSVAFPVLFICSDLEDVSLESYDASEEVHMFRHERDFQRWIEDKISWGIAHDTVPIICAYNLMFDLQPAIYSLNQRYRIVANAQSSTHVYTLDLTIRGRILLRFWDTFHLEMRGLAAMGDTCGFEKAVGDWDYKLVRTPDTPLTDEELFYAKRDVQVIPTYLKWLLDTNEWLHESDLGVRVITKTSLVRRQSACEIGPLESGDTTVRRAYMSECAREFPKTYDQYAIRKACFRGGFTFTAAATAHKVMRDVASFDVTSMHHAFINGRLLPVGFRPTPPSVLDRMCAIVVRTGIDRVLTAYDMPFPCAFHACLTFTDIRLRKGSAFDTSGIALIPEGKFRRTGTGAEWNDSESDIDAESAIRGYGYGDECDTPLFAFGKLYRARSCRLHVCEIELWCLSRVYEWDSMTVEYGESTTAFRIPPDYVTLQSNLLFERKQAMKRVLRDHGGEIAAHVPVTCDLPSSIPAGIRAGIRDGTADIKDLESYYASTVKGMFNGIYGVQAQDLMKPSYSCVDGKLSVDRSTVTTRDNYEDRMPEHPKSIYTYGMRIVAGSRMHLVIAIELVHGALADRARVLGGDTDSLKIALDGATPQEVLDAIGSLHVAVTSAIGRTQARVRADHPDMASTLDGIGTFEYEGSHEQHIEFWNKARVSCDGDAVSVTCAGLPRPKGRYTVEDWISDRIRDGWTFERAVLTAMGYNRFIANDVSHVLERTRPNPWDRVDMDVTDHLGTTSRVRAHASQALYDGGRLLGDTTKRSNSENVHYLEMMGRRPDTDPVTIDREGFHRG